MSALSLPWLALPKFCSGDSTHDGSVIKPILQQICINQNLLIHDVSCILCCVHGVRVLKLGYYNPWSWACFVLMCSHCHSIVWIIIMPRNIPIQQGVSHDLFSYFLAALCRYMGCNTVGRY